MGSKRRDTQYCGVVIRVRIDRGACPESTHLVPGLCSLSLSLFHSCSRSVSQQTLTYPCLSSPAPFQFLPNFKSPFQS